MAEFELKDFATLANAVSGLIGISLAVAGNVYAWVYIVAALFFDFIDGKIARSTKVSEFGKQLDSLADAVSFAVAPTVVIMLSNLPSIFLTAACAFYVCAGLWRLAKFNLQKNRKSYYGLPSPFAALIVLVTAVFASQFIVLILVACGIAMLIPFEIKKI